ncbi:hypothetical protein AB0D45_29485 [Streptomyces sp. NPDC048352]|uniref:hypothetical protein n=1 Tax=Streptomyces sp. NPDC048352 TaxID=3154718 RepID=UPI00341AD2BA
MISTVTSGALEQLEALVQGLKEGSESKVKEALARACQEPAPGGQKIDIGQLVKSAAPKEVAALLDGGTKAAGGATGALGDATKPLGVWEAELPQIEMAWYDGLVSAVNAIGNALGGGVGTAGRAASAAKNLAEKNKQG